MSSVASEREQLLTEDETIRTQHERTNEDGEVVYYLGVTDKRFIKIVSTGGPSGYLITSYNLQHPNKLKTRMADVKRYTFNTKHRIAAFVGLMTSLIGFLFIPTAVTNESVLSPIIAPNLLAYVVLLVILGLLSCVLFIKSKSSYNSIRIRLETDETMRTVYIANDARNVAQEIIKLTV